MGQADDDRPLDVDWQTEALETDSYSDVVTSAAERKRSISNASNMRLLHSRSI